MGYSYTLDWKLYCDICGKPHARKHKCPYGWCQPYAICSDCWKKPEVKQRMTKDAHSKCKEISEYDMERYRIQDELLNEGKYVRCSAITVGYEIAPYNVKVTFRNKEGKTKEFLMSKDTYGSYPLLTPTTPDHYIANGLVFPVENL